MAHAEREGGHERERERGAQRARRHGAAAQLGAQAQRGRVRQHGAQLLRRRVLVQEGPRAQLVAHALRAPPLARQPRRLTGNDVLSLVFLSLYCFMSKRLRITQRSLFSDFN